MKKEIHEAKILKDPIEVSLAYQKSEINHHLVVTHRIESLIKVLDIINREHGTKLKVSNFSLFDAEITIESENDFTITIDSQDHTLFERTLALGIMVGKKRYRGKLASFFEKIFGAWTAW